MTSELVFLRARVRRLETEVEITRRLAHLEDQDPPRTRIWRFIERESAHFEITALCEACGVSRSAYYAWLKKGGGPSDADLDEAYLANVIYDIWRKSRRRCGVPRVTAALANQGVRVNDKRVARVMGQLGIEGISRRRKMKTIRRRSGHVVAAELVERDFRSEASDALDAAAMVRARGSLRRHGAAFAPRPAVHGRGLEGPLRCHGRAPGCFQIAHLAQF